MHILPCSHVKLGAILADQCRLEEVDEPAAGFSLCKVPLFFTLVKSHLGDLRENAWPVLGVPFFP